MARLDESIARICDELETAESKFFLTADDKSNFRYGLAKDYKANRTQPKPVHYMALRTHLREAYGADTVEGHEADDAIGIWSTAHPDYIIVSIDKDLDQLPGWHYNFVKLIKYQVSKLAGMRSFYTQVLVGDPGDNVKGCPKIGPVKAQRSLEGCLDEIEMLATVTERYASAYKGEDWIKHLLLSGNLLWLRRKVGQPWTLTSGEVVSNETLKQSYEGTGFPINTKPGHLTISCRPKPGSTTPTSSSSEEN